MKLSLLIIGTILFFIGAFTKINLLIAAGMILMIMSFFGKVIKEKEKKPKPETQKKIFTSKSKCLNCGAEILPEDNYCPECGEKILP